MGSSLKPGHNHLVVDSIHGDIHLTDIERRVVDTASFQRLRQLKQLGMGHFTYPNATHTRFAHSLGVLGIMEHVQKVAKQPLGLTDEQIEDMRLACLLHDIGHYPYSHLMERVDAVQLTEEFVADQLEMNLSKPKYPSHEELGKLIVTHQKDLVKALGSKERAQRIAQLFTGDLENPDPLSKLIHSSMDLDRLDYLLRDAHATGVPYGRVDLNYILNNLRTSPTGMLGVDKKAMAAAEHALLARFFMYRTVYYHKTTFGFEEACRQLLRRLRNGKRVKIAPDGESIRKLVMSTDLLDFTDAYVDRRIHEAVKSQDRVISELASSIANRRPPKLLKEVPVFARSDDTGHDATIFRQNCKHKLKKLAGKNKIPLGLFLCCKTKSLKLEDRGSLLTAEEARKLQPAEKEELVKVFLDNNKEPKSLVDIKYSLIHHCSNHSFQSFRLYVVKPENIDNGRIEEMREEVSEWDKAG